MKRLLYMAAMAMVASLVLASTALAQDELTPEEQECISALSLTPEGQAAEGFTEEELQACRDLVLNIEVGDTVFIEQPAGVPEPFFVADTFFQEGTTFIRIDQTSELVPQEGGQQVIVNETGEEVAVAEFGLVQGNISVVPAEVQPEPAAPEETPEEEMPTEEAAPEPAPEAPAEEPMDDTEMLPDTGGPGLTLLLPATALLLATGLLGGLRVMRRRP